MHGNHEKAEEIHMGSNEEHLSRTQGAHKNEPKNGMHEKTKTGR